MIPNNNAPQKPTIGPKAGPKEVVQQYPSGKDSRMGAAQRSQAAKQKELVRRGSDSGNASKHARNMVACQSTGNPDGTPSY